MSMNFWRLTAGLFLLGSLGCTPTTPPVSTPSDTTPVGIVDLDRAAEKLGLSHQVEQILQAQRQKLGAELTEVQKKMQSQLDAKKKEFGETPAQKDKEQLQLMELQ